MEQARDAFDSDEITWLSGDAVITERTTMRCLHPSHAHETLARV